MSRHATTRTQRQTRRSCGVPAWVLLDGQRRADGGYRPGYHDLTTADQQRTQRNAVITAIVMGLAALAVVSMTITTAPDLLAGYAAVYAVAAWLAFCIFRRSRQHTSPAAAARIVHASTALAGRLVARPVIVGAQRLLACRAARDMQHASITHRRSVAVRSAGIHGLAHIALVESRLTSEQAIAG